MGDTVQSCTDIRAARLAAGLTLEQVSSRTKIRAGILRDLEGGTVASSGGLVYARGHLKAVAAATGADVDAILAVFDRDHLDRDHPAGSVAAPPAQRRARSAASSPARRPGIARITYGEAALTGADGTDAGAAGANAAAGYDAAPAEKNAAPAGADAAPARVTAAGLLGSGSRKAFAGGAFLVVASVVVLAGMLLMGTLTAGHPRAARPLSALAATAAPTAKAAPVLPPAPPAPPAALQLRLSGGPSWVRVSNGSGVLVEGTLPSGYGKEFSDASQLSVIIGRKRNVQLSCGGKQVAIAGKGDVLRFTCSSAGVAPA